MGVPLGSDEERRDQRVALERSTLQVRSVIGEAIAGARVRALPIGREGGDLQGYLDTVVECDRLFVWGERTHRLESAGHTGASGSDGQVVLGLEPDGDGTAPWLLVVAKPGFGTDWRVVPREQLVNGGILVELRAEPPTRVQVLKDGAPVAGAQVVLQAMFEEAWTPASLDLEQRSRRALRHTATTDEEGVATLPRIRGRCRVLAGSGAWESLPWTGESPSDVSLSLAPTFEVFGRVQRTDGLPLNEWAHVCLSAWDAQRLLWVPCRTVFPNARGEFEGLSAAIGASRYRVQAVLTGARDEFRDLQSPRAGTRREVNLELAPEAALWLTAIDATDTSEEPASIPGAVFDITWQGFGGSFQSLRARAGGNGYAWVRELPSGAQYWFSATAPGFGRDHFGPYVIPADGPAVFASALDPASYQRARVTLAGQPVRGFLLRTFRPNKPELSAFESIRADVNGEFSIPRGRAAAQVQAWLPDQGASDWVNLPGSGKGDASTDDALLELKIQPFGSLRGLVVAAASGEPIAEANVRWRDARSRSGAGFELPVSTTSDAEGRFEVADIGSPGGAELVIRAPGYQTLLVDAWAASRAAPGSGGDLGDLRLEPAKVVELVLAGAGRETSFDRGVVGRGFAEKGARYFDADGRQLWTHDFGLFQFEVRLGVNHGRVYPRDISGKIAPRSGRQVIRYFPPSGSPILLRCRELPDEAEESDVVVAFEPLSGEHPFIREVLVPRGSGPVSLPRLEPGQYSAKLSLVGQGPFARDEVDVRGETQELVVSGSAGRWDFRIQREDGGLVSQATIYVAGDSSSAPVQTRTLDGGWAGVAFSEAPRSVSGRFEDGAVFSQLPIEWEGKARQSGRVAVGELRSIPIVVEGHQGGGMQAELGLFEPQLGVELARIRTDANGLAHTPLLPIGRYLLSPTSDRHWPTRRSFDGSEFEWSLHLPGYGQIDACLLGADGERLANQPVQVRHAALGTGSTEWIASGLFTREDFLTSSEGVLSLPGVPAGWIEISTAGQQGALRVWIEAGETHREDLDWGR